MTAINNGILEITANGSTPIPLMSFTRLHSTTTGSTVYQINKNNDFLIKSLLKSLKNTRKTPLNQPEVRTTNYTNTVNLINDLLAALMAVPNLFSSTIRHFDVGTITREKQKDTKLSRSNKSDFSQSCERFFSKSDLNFFKRKPLHRIGPHKRSKQNGIDKTRSGTGARAFEPIKRTFQIGTSAPKKGIQYKFWSFLWSMSRTLSVSETQILLFAFWKKYFLEVGFKY